jgi:nucleotide-binding universal stress UspA family protein
MEDTDTRFVVGMDGSPESREALRWASRLAGVLGGEIVAVHAMGLLERLDREPVAAAEVIERDWCSSLRTGVTSYRVVVRDGSPIDVLPAVAVEERAALLVVGSRGTGSAPALAIGSTSLHLLQNAQVPVLVVPSGDSGHVHLGLRRVLVAADETARTDSALEVVAWLAAGFGSRVELVHAVDDLRVFPLGSATAVSVAGEADASSIARSLLEPVRRRLDVRGVPADVRIGRGRAVEVVRSAAAAMDADLVVLASSHVGETPGSLLGESVSRRVASVVHRPVLVVPVAARIQPELAASSR